MPISFGKFKKQIISVDDLPDEPEAGAGSDNSVSGRLDRLGALIKAREIEIVALDALTPNARNAKGTRSAKLRCCSKISRS